LFDGTNVQIQKLAMNKCEIGILEVKPVSEEHRHFFMLMTGVWLI